MPDVTELAKRLRECHYCGGRGWSMSDDFIKRDCEVCRLRRRAADELERLAAENASTESKLAESVGLLRDAYGVPMTAAVRRKILNFVELYQTGSSGATVHRKI